MLNPESVMLNLFQHLFRAGLFQHPIKSKNYETLKLFQGDKRDFSEPSNFLLDKDFLIC
jgi:hypothetical protein